MRRILAALCAGAMLLSSAALAANTTAPRVTLTASKGEEKNEIVLTVGVRDVAFNVLQFAVDYDESKLTPKSVVDNEPVTDPDYMTDYLAPLYSAETETGWLNTSFGTFDTTNGVVEYTLYADPGSRGGENGSDADGYATAGSEGLNLIALHFTLKDTAVFTADSIQLAATASNKSYIILSSKNPADPRAPVMLESRSLGLRDFTAFDIPLADTTEPEPPKEPDMPNPPDQSNGSSSSGNTGSAGNTGSGTSKLTDVSGHWAEKYINELADKGILTGYGDGTFRPEKSINRGEFCIVISRALGLEPQKDGSVFGDLDGIWAAPYIYAVYDAGLVSGVGGDSFAAGRAITRQEAFKIIAAALKLPVGPTASFPDMGEVQPWALAGVNSMTAAGLVTGDSAGRLNPAREISRGEIAALVSRALAAGGM